MVLSLVGDVNYGGEKPRLKAVIRRCAAFVNARNVICESKHLAARGALIVRRSDSEMKRNAEIGLLTKSSRML
jgi:hypothetical protein